MKKLKYLIFTVLISLILMPTVFAKANVEITSVELEELNGVAEEINTPKFKDLDLKMDIKFNEINDSVKYKVVIKNNDDVNYKLKLESDNKNGKIIYDYSVGETIAPNSETLAYITAKYNEEITNFVDGKYEEKGTAVITLLTEEEEPIENPETGVYSYITLVAIILLIAYIINRKVSNKNKFKYMSIIVLLLVSPLMVKAYEETLTLNVVTNIVVAEENQFCIFNKYVPGPLSSTSLLGQSRDPNSKQKQHFVTYQNGMTWGQFEESKYISDMGGYASDEDTFSAGYNIEELYSDGYYFISKEYILNDAYDVYNIYEDYFNNYLKDHNMTYDEYNNLSNEEQNDIDDETFELFKKDILGKHVIYSMVREKKIMPSSKGCYFAITFEK